jgi:hypothetical protein
VIRSCSARSSPVCSPTRPPIPGKVKVMGKTPRQVPFDILTTVRQRLSSRLNSARLCCCCSFDRVHASSLVLAFPIARLLCYLPPLSPPSHPPPGVWVLQASPLSSAFRSRGCPRLWPPYVELTIDPASVVRSPLPPFVVHCFLRMESLAIHKPLGELPVACCT